MRVKQISIDVAVFDGTDGCKLAEDIERLLKADGYMVMGACFQEDMTEAYKEVLE